MIRKTCPGPICRFPECFFCLNTYSGELCKSFCFSVPLRVYDRLKHQGFIICTAPVFIHRLRFWQEIDSWGPGVPASRGVTAGRAHGEAPAVPRSWLACSAALLPQPRKHRSERNLEGFAGAARCFRRL